MFGPAGFSIKFKRMKPLYEIIRLTYQKSEILNERINTIIESLGSGETLR